MKNTTNNEWTNSILIYVLGPIMSLLNCNGHCNKSQWVLRFLGIKMYICISCTLYDILMALSFRKCY